MTGRHRRGFDGAQTENVNRWKSLESRRHSGCRKPYLFFCTGDRRHGWTLCHELLKTSDEYLAVIRSVFLAVVRQ